MYQRCGCSHCAPRRAKSSAENASANALPAVQLDTPEDVEVPARLLSEERMQAMQAQYQPHFVPLARAPAHAPMSAKDPRPPADPVTGAAPLLLAVCRMHISWSWITCLAKVMLRCRIA